VAPRSGARWNWPKCRLVDAPGIDGGLTHRPLDPLSADRWGRVFLRDPERFDGGATCVANLAGFGTKSHGRTLIWQRDKEERQDEYNETKPAIAVPQSWRGKPYGQKT
jgi:hypothetical protein